MLSLTPKDVHSLIGGTWENVSLHGKGDFTDPEMGRLSWMMSEDPI